jgi:hypothetical protein
LTYPILCRIGKEVSGKTLKEFNDRFCGLFIEDPVDYGMKRFSITIWLALIILLISFAFEAMAKGKIIKPKECRASNYTCVLKKTDGVPFWCVRTTRQRQQNARKKIRIVSRRNCIRRYPVEYEVERTVQPKQEE